MSYVRLAPTAQIGVFKRCLRLIAHLVDDYEVHLVNYGPVPEGDGTLASLRPRFQLHRLPEISLGDELWDLCGALRPRAVVLGEAPARGNMRLSSRVASRRGLWQIAVENGYAPLVGRVMPRAFPKVDRWLLLGLPAAPDRTSEGRTDLLLPLVGPVRADMRPRDRLCLVGYDRQTLLSGLELLRHLPATTGADIVTLPDWLPVLQSREAELAGRDVTLLVLPADPALHRAVARSQVVFGKAGFQQMAEAILLGARVVCRSAGGGVVPELVPDHLLPFVRWMSAESDLPEVVDTVMAWLEAPVVGQWLRLLHQRADATAYAAARLRAMVEEAPPAPGAG